MTQNQFYFAQLSEQERSHRAEEAETTRANQAREAFNLMSLAESIRHSQAQEGIDRERNYQQARSNDINERYGLFTLEETAKHNRAMEETNRYQAETSRLTTDNNFILGQASNRIANRNADTQATKVAADTANARKNTDIYQSRVDTQNTVDIYNSMVNAFGTAGDFVNDAARNLISAADIFGKGGNVYETVSKTGENLRQKRFSGKEAYQRSEPQIEAVYDEETGHWKAHPAVK